MTMPPENNGTYICQGVLGGWEVEYVTGLICQAFDGAPTGAGYHPGTFVLHSDNPASAGVWKCANGVTVSYEQGTMTVHAASGVTRLSS